MITAAALTSPRLQPSVTRASGHPGTASVTTLVTCRSTTKVTIYNCRNSDERACVMWGMSGVFSVANVTVGQPLSPTVGTSGKRIKEGTQMESVVNDYISREIVQDPARRR